MSSIKTTLITLILISFCNISLANPNLSANQESFKFFRGSKTYIKNPFELRDPFKRKTFKRSAKRKKKFGSFVVGNSFSNLPSIENVPLSKIRVVGILLGKERRAMAKIADASGKAVGEDTFILKEGMLLGEDKAELKAILPGGIVLVEKIRNVYDQDEYLETVIPVSSE